MLQRILLVLACFSLSSSLGSAQELSYLVTVIDGDAYGGGTVDTIQNVAVNDRGDWIVHATLSGVDVSLRDVVIRNGVLVAQSCDGVTVPGGGEISLFEAFGIDSAGGDAFLYKLKNTSAGTANDFAAFVNGNLVVQEGDLINLPEFDATAVYGNLFDLKFNDRSEFLLNCVVSDPIIPGSPDSALIRINVGVGQTRTIALEGDVLPGNPGRAIEFFSMQPEDTALNEAGDAIFIVDLSGDALTERAIYLWDDDQGMLLIAQKGDPAPGGSAYNSFSQRGIDVNESAQYVFQASRQDGVDVLVTDAGLFIAEGDPVPGKPSETIADLGTFAPAEIDGQGRVLWMATWSTINGTSGLFLDQALLLEENVTNVAPGITVTALEKGSNAYHTSSSGEWVIARAITSPGGKEAAVLIQTEPTCQVDLGFGGPGTAQLSICGGDLSGGTSADLLLTGAPPSAPGLLVVGESSNPTMLFGGTIVPLPFLFLQGLTTDANGEFSMPGLIGGGGPYTLFGQAVVLDASQQAGFAFSNALQVDFLP